MNNDDFLNLLHSSIHVRQNRGGVDVKHRRPREEHIDVRVSSTELKEILSRVPEGVNFADWVRGTLLSETVQRDRVIRTKTYRDVTPYRSRLRGDALLSLASSLSWLSGASLDAKVEAKIKKVLELVTREILGGGEQC